MGASRWSDAYYEEREAMRKRTGSTAFAYDADLKALPSAARCCHDKLNPLGVKIRESRDSDVHPESLAIGVLFDVTGSMGQIPVTLQKKLPQLLGLLIKKGYVDHPQILFGGIGDATCDRVPLQIGQFESGIEMDDDLSRMYLEGGGGGHITESYELAMYFMARHTSLDCVEKRGHKGYLFLIGDETPYLQVKKTEVKDIIGDTVQESLATSAIVAELQQKYEVFFIVPTGASNGGDDTIRNTWKKLLGQNVLQLDDPAAVCETIALQIGLCEGKIDLDDGVNDLRSMGVNSRTARSASRAVVPVDTSARSVATVTAASLPDMPGKRGGKPTTRRL